MRRIALHMFDGAEVLLRREFHIFGRHIIGEVEPGATLTRHRPKHIGGPGLGLRAWGRDVRGGCPKRGERLAGGIDSRLQTGGGGVLARASPRRDQPGDRILRRNKATDCLVPNRAGVHVAGQVHGGVPAARDSKAVGRDGFFAASMADGDLAQSLAAFGRDDLPAGDHAVIALGLDLGPAVDNGGHIDPGLGQVSGGAVGVVIGGKERHLFTGRDTITVQIGPHGAGHHDAGPVIHRKGDRAF